MDADFRVFYGIHGIADGHYGDLSAPRFVALAERLPFYKGVMRGRIEIEQAEEAERPRAPVVPSSGPVVKPPIDEFVDSIPMEAMA